MSTNEGGGGYGFVEYRALLLDSLKEGKEHRQRIETKLDGLRKDQQDELALMRKDISDERLNMHSEVATLKTKVALYGSSVGAVAGMIAAAMVKLFFG